MKGDQGLIRTWVIAFVIAAAVGFGGLIGIGCLVGANACPFGESPDSITSTEGRVIWLNRCAICHGREGGGGEGPSLVTGASTDLTLEELQEKISRGRPFMGMPRFKGELSEEQIESVARYVITLRGDAP